MATQQHIFWDNDGTLVDSESLAMAVAVDAVIAAFADFTDPSTFPPSDRMALITGWAGLQFGQMLDITEMRYNSVLPKSTRAEVVEQCRIDTLHVLQTVEVIPGVADVIDHFAQRDILSSVVTSSALERVLPGLAHTELLPRFTDLNGQRVYSAETTLPTPQPKPHPAIYLYALDRHNADPRDVVAIEDSPSGVRAAKAAGIRVIGWTAAPHITDKIGHAERLRDAGAFMTVGQPAQLRDAIVRAFEEPAHTFTR